MMMMPLATNMPPNLRLALDYNQNENAELAFAASAANLQQNLSFGL
jgi:hypothetical protein